MNKVEIIDGITYEFFIADNRKCATVRQCDKNAVNVTIPISIFACTVTKIDD